MIVDFTSADWVEIPHMNGGEGSVFAKMSVTEDTRIVITRIPSGSSIGKDTRIVITRIPSGSSIGKHLQSSGDDVNYVLAGKGKAICDGIEEKLTPGMCHICPKGHEHSIVNDGKEDLILFTTVPIPH